MSKTEYRRVPELDHSDEAAFIVDRTFQVIRDGVMVGPVRIITDTSGPVASIRAEGSDGVTPAEINGIGQQYADVVGRTVSRVLGALPPMEHQN